MPNTLSLAVAVAVSASGKTDGSSTRTSVMVRGVLVSESV